MIPYDALTTGEKDEYKRITQSVLEEVGDERQLQDVKWGVDRSFPNSLQYETEFCNEMANKVKQRLTAMSRKGQVDWASILEEEFWEALAEAQDGTKLRAELIQVAAVCVAWIEALDRQ